MIEDIWRDSPMQHDEDPVQWIDEKDIEMGLSDLELRILKEDTSAPVERKQRQKEKYRNNVRKNLFRRDFK